MLEYFKKHPIRFLWQVLFFIPVNITRLLFCFMVAVFNFDYKTFIEAWEVTE